MLSPLLAILPPGAFITLGLLIAGKNWLNLRAEEKARGGNVESVSVAVAQGGH